MLDKLSCFVRERQPCLRINLLGLCEYSFGIMWFIFGCFYFPRTVYNGSRVVCYRTKIFDATSCLFLMLLKLSSRDSKLF